MKDLLLISLPWSRYDATSLQLGALKSFLHDQGFQVDTRHFHKDLIGYLDGMTYQLLFEAYMGEPCFAALLYPDRYEKIKSAVTLACQAQSERFSPASASLNHPAMTANLSLAEQKQIYAEAAIPGKRQAIDFDAVIGHLTTFLDDVFNNTNWDDFKK